MKVGFTSEVMSHVVSCSYFDSFMLRKKRKCLIIISDASYRFPTVSLSSQIPNMQGGGANMASTEEIPLVAAAHQGHLHGMIYAKP